MPTTSISRGLGDSIAKLTAFLRVPHCGGCERRRESLNRLVPYRPSASNREYYGQSAARSSASPSMIYPLPARQSFLVRPGRIEIPRRSIVMANAGGWRAPGGRSGPLDWEGERRHERSTSGQTSPATSGAPGSFACGIDVTESTKSAIRATKSAFFHWTNDQRHQACKALHSLSVGDIAWDILELHSQVTSDALNKPFRPSCATSGATPACGSSVTIGGSCHFAGSANYVIFGIMCRLCHDHYENMLSNASFYEIFDKDTYRQEKLQFGITGMLGLVDLYKKYVPLLTGDAPARNIDAAKRWSIAGWNGWPNRAATPPPDRANCTLTCPHRAAQPFTISWYPFVNPYARRRGIR
jgi:hypothetical protein